MTKRDAALIPLTHDHHHALAQARRLIEASDSDAEERKLAGESFVHFYQEDTLLHFHEEEEVLFPVFLEHVGEPPPELTQVLIEHVRIHGMVTRLRDSLPDGAPDGALIKKLGETLRAHVRLEENKLFPLIENAVPPKDLGSITFEPRARGGPAGQ